MKVAERTTMREARGQRGHRRGSNMSKDYKAPEFEEFGTVADLTQVGQTNPGDDVLPGNAQGMDGGSVSPPGLSR